jgi:hypothetical protein
MPPSVESRPAEGDTYVCRLSGSHDASDGAEPPCESASQRALSSGDESATTVAIDSALGLHVETMPIMYTRYPRDMTEYMDLAASTTVRRQDML